MIFSSKGFDNIRKKRINKGRDDPMFDFEALLLYKLLEKPHYGPIRIIDAKTVKHMSIATKFGKVFHGNNRTKGENMLAVAKNVLNIANIPYYQKDRSFMLLASAEFSYIIRFIPEEMKTREIINTALRSSPELIKFIPDHLVTLIAPETFDLVLRSQFVTLESEDEVLYKNSRRSHTRYVYIPSSWQKYGTRANANNQNKNT